MGTCIFSCDWFRSSPESIVRPSRVSFHLATGGGGGGGGEEGKGSPGADSESEKQPSFYRKYTLEEIVNSWPWVVGQTAEVQARFAETSIRFLAAHPLMAKKVYEAMRKDFPLKVPTNSSDLGNLAFMSFYCEDTELQKDFVSLWTDVMLLLGELYMKKTK